MTDRTTASSPSRHRIGRAVAALALAGAMLGTTGCSLINSFMPRADPTRDEATGEITERNDHADVFSLRVGDCINDDAMGDEIMTVPVVPCGEPHTDEVYFAFNLTDGEFPGVDELEQIGFEGCLDEFEGFVGAPYETSELDIWPIFPTSGSWAEGDREILCLIYDYEAGEVSGSLRGAGR